MICLLNGETNSKLQGIKIVETNNIDTVATGITVYPSYFIGRDAYSVLTGRTWNYLAYWISW